MAKTKKRSRDVEMIRSLLICAMARGRTLAEEAEAFIANGQANMRKRRKAQRAAHGRPMTQEFYEKEIRRTKTNNRRVKRLMKTYASMRIGSGVGALSNGLVVIRRNDAPVC